MTDKNNMDINMEKFYDYIIRAKIISYLCTGGALVSQDTIIRTTEIKGILRWFIRYYLYAKVLDGIISEKFAKYILEDIFGSIEKPSFFDIIVIPKFDIKENLVNSGEILNRLKNFGNIRNEIFGHRLKNSNLHYIDPKKRDLYLDIIFLKRRKLELNILKGKERDIFEIFKIILHIFGFGKMYRRGFGKIEVEDLAFYDINRVFNELNKKIANIFGKELYFRYYEGETINKNEINNEDIIVHLLYDGCNDIDECINKIANSVNKNPRKKFNDKNSYIGIFMGLPRSNKIRINKQKIPSSVIYSINKNKGNNKYQVYTIILTKSKKIVKNKIKDILKDIKDFGYKI